ncbi:MAG: Uma2 family endonuclease [Neomegalonema sp.]|nr:Uma2 family endonuclease [Neomegalonema sp.]
MSHITPEPPGPMTSQEFLAWATQDDVGRVELIDGTVVAMAAETARHGLVKKNIDRAFDFAIERAGRACASFVDSIAVEIDRSSVFIPDVVIDCGDLSDLDRISASEPVVVVEVLSRSTTRHDRSHKLLGYFATPSIAHYLIVMPIERRVLHHAREADEIRTRILGTGTLALEPPGLSLSIDDFWRGLPEPAARPT